MTSVIARVLVVIVLAGTLHAEPAPMSLKWSELSGAIHNKNLTVDLNDGSSIRASESSVEPSTLVVNISSDSHPTYKKGRVSIPRDQIAGLRLIRTSKHGRGIGLAVGVLGGIAAGAAAGSAAASSQGGGLDNLDSRVAIGGVLFIVVAVAVSLAGFFIGMHFDRQEVRIAILPD